MKSEERKALLMDIEAARQYGSASPEYAMLMVLVIIARLVLKIAVKITAGDL